MVGVARSDSVSMARRFWVVIESYLAHRPRNFDNVFHNLLVLYARFGAVLIETTGCLTPSDNAVKISVIIIVMIRIYGKPWSS